MKPSCPKCGSPAAETSQKQITTECSDIAFTCQSEQCKLMFTGRLTLLSARLNTVRPGVRHFKSTMPDNPDGTLRTDC